MLETSVKLFGSARRTQLLVALSLMEESYPSELARLIDARLYAVQQIIEALEDEGVVATRLVGRQRMVRLNPQYFARNELQEMLRRIADAMPRLRERVARLRTRPRKRGKEL